MNNLRRASPRGAFTLAVALIFTSSSGLEAQALSGLAQVEDQPAESLTLTPVSPGCVPSFGTFFMLAP